MSVKDDYLAFKAERCLKPGKFEDRVKLQSFIRDRLEDLWREGISFSSGGLLKNYMTGYALGFAYYDCRPTSFCKTRCYGLPLGGVFDFNMLRLSVVTSESLKTGDHRYMNAVIGQLRRNPFQCLKIGHWGDAVPAQIHSIAEIVRQFPNMTFWWYTRKMELALQVNQLGLQNLRAYLSLDPRTPYPRKDQYPFGLTYFYQVDRLHDRHDEIVRDDRLIAIFSLKKGQSVEDPASVGLSNHSRMCIEKKWKAQGHPKGDLLCLSCRDRCNFTREHTVSGIESAV